jgi:hypothetical protein
VAETLFQGTKKGLTLFATGRFPSIMGKQLSKVTNYNVAKEVAEVLLAKGNAQRSEG